MLALPCPALWLSCSKPETAASPLGLLGTVLVCQCRRRLVHFPSQIPPHLLPPRAPCSLPVRPLQPCSLITLYPAYIT
ncbi:hypothetical protein E2C01_080028 [Portunus trituberculatus]|uniref:Uncharacterized protein n=1 Tax=Portunus trituberculatus TaxID=210409 RepID=A0A5B7ISB9_PORTR|nr:hypothetical protein [Portunus trituberculatus]